jgi:hypothetical protein
MHKVTNVTVLDEYKLRLTFDDGAKGIVDLSALRGNGVFAAWNDPEVFRSVRIGSLGELVWKGEIDLCPDALYLQATQKSPEEVFPALKRIDAHA